MSKSSGKMVLILAMAVFLVQLAGGLTPGQADTTYWTGIKGDWDDITNWDLSVPDADTNAYIDKKRYKFCTKKIRCNVRK